MKTYLSFLVSLSLLVFTQLGNAQETGSPKYLKSLDSLKLLLESAQGKAAFPLLLELTEQTRRVDPELGESYVLRAEKFLNKNKVNQELFDYYAALSKVRISQHRYEESIELSEKALSLEYEPMDFKKRIDAHSILGLSLSFLGKMEKAHEALFKGLHIVDSLDLDERRATYYNDIGSYFSGMNDHVQMEKYLLMAIEKDKERGENSTTDIAMSNLSILYTSQKRYTEAEKILLKTIERLKVLGERNMIGTISTNLGVLYNFQAKYKESLPYLQDALTIAYEFKNNSDITLGHINVGEGYMWVGKNEDALFNLEKGLSLARESKKLKFETAALWALSLFYEKQGKHLKALDYYKEYTATNDRMLNENRVKAVAELQEKYETEKKEKEIMSLSNEKIESQRKMRNRNWTIFGLLLGLMGVGGILYSARQNHLKKTIIQQKNLEIAADAIQLLERQKEITKLESLMLGQEHERERLAKELHDGLGGLLAISHSKLTDLAGTSDKIDSVLQQASELVGEAYVQVRQVSHNLMPLDLEKFGLQATLENMISRLNQQHSISFDFHTYNFDEPLNNDLGLNIYRIVQEAITNILKYAQAKNVLIELIQHEDIISLTVEDDGLGFDVDDAASGIGLSNMQNRSEILDGTFSIDSKPSEGTTVSIQIPYQVRESVEV